MAEVVTGLVVGLLFTVFGFGWWLILLGAVRQIGKAWRGER